MAPAANHSSSQDETDATFNYTNAIPQNEYVNRNGTWKKFESYERKLLENKQCRTL